MHEPGCEHYGREQDDCIADSSYGKWRTFIDAYATQDPIPRVDVIFRAMKALEERWTSRNDREYEEANYMGRGGGGSSYGSYKAKG